MQRARVGNVWQRLLLDSGNFDSPVHFRTEDNDVTRWLTAALSEYSSLRAESLHGLNVQHTIMQFGVAGIAVLIGVALQNGDPILSSSLLLLLIPMLANFLVLVWAGELTRSARASAYILRLEQKVNTVLGGEVPALEWEAWLRDHPRALLYWYYRAEFVAVFVVETAAVVLGGYLSFRADVVLFYPRAVVGAVGTSSITLLLFSIWLYRKCSQRIRHEFMSTLP